MEGQDENEYENTCKHGFYVDDCQTCAHLAELGEGPDAEEVRVGSESVDENSSGGATVTAGRGDESVGDERRAEGEERETSSGGGEEVDYGACVYCGERALCHHLVCYCKPCQTTAVCEHSRLKSQCSTHKCKRNCKHNHDRLTCAECNEIELCGHGDTFTPRCRACLFSHPCKEHDVILAECELCEPLENRNWLRQMVLRRERRSLKKWCDEHDVLLVKCTVCKPPAEKDSAQKKSTKQKVSKPPAEQAATQKSNTQQLLNPPTEENSAPTENTKRATNPNEIPQPLPHFRPKCPHNRVPYYCRECGGKGLCVHNKRLYKCMVCGTAKLCEHDKVKYSCKLCSQPRVPKDLTLKRGKWGAILCPHNIPRNRCLECVEKGVCEHKQRAVCEICGAAKMCWHGRIKDRCASCGQGAAETGKCNHGIDKGTSCDRCIEDDKKYLQWRERRRLGAALWRKRQRECTHGIARSQCTECRTTTEAKANKCNHGADKDTSCDECKQEKKKQVLERKRLYGKAYRQKECMHGIARWKCMECRKVWKETKGPKKLSAEQPQADDSQTDDAGVGSAPSSLPPLSNHQQTTLRVGLGTAERMPVHVQERHTLHREMTAWHGRVGPRSQKTDSISLLDRKSGECKQNDAGSGFVPPPLGPLLHHQQTAWGVGMGEAGNLPVHVQGNAGSGFVPPPSASHPYQQQMTCGMGTAAAGSIPVHVQVPPSPGPPDQMDFGSDESDGVEDHAPPPVTKRKRKAKAPLSEQPPRVRQKRKSKATNRPSLDQPAVTQPNTGDETSPPDTPIPPPSDAPATSKSSGRKRAPNARRPEHVTITGVWKNKLICEHGGDWRKCRICSPEEYCAHNRVYYRCPKCRILRMCDVHQKSRRLCKCPVPPGTVEADAHKDVHRALPDTMADGNPQGDLHPGASGQYCIICRPYLGCVHQMLRNACAICASEINTWRREKQRGERQCAHGNAEPACVTCHPELAATCFHGMETRDCGVCMEEREAAAGRNPGDGNIGEEEREEGEAESGPKKHHRVPPAQVPCEHGWVFACPLCFPALICQHESAFSECDICMTSLKKHAKWWGERTPAPKRICPHGKGEQYCTECRPHLGCRHGVLHSNCNRCRKEFDRWAEQKRREERRCMHGSLEVSCETCELELSEVCPHDVATRDCVACLGEREKELDSINLRCRHRKPPGECVVCMEGGDTEIDSEEDGKAGKKRLCKHGCIRACPLCFPQLVCKHNITFSTCTVCMTSLNRSRHWRSQGDFSQENRERPHRRLGQTCTTHGVPKNRCLPCKPHMGCRHGRFLTQCKPCRKEVRGWWEQRWREERICMHRRLEVSCETCKLELSAVCPHDVATRDCVGCLGEREKELESINATCYHGVPVSKCAFCLEQRQKRQRNTEGEERGGEETQTEEEGVEGAEEGESEGENGGAGVNGKQKKKNLRPRYRCNHGRVLACPLCFPQLVCMHKITFSTCIVCMTSLREYRPRIWYGRD